MNIHQGHRDKMRQRFLVTGLRGFADHEALELLLYYALPRQDTNQLAHELMNRYRTLSAVLHAPIEDLRQVDGIGECAAILLKLVSELVQKARVQDLSRELICDSSERVGEYLLECFDGARNEQIFELCLDKKGKLLTSRQLTEGGANFAELDIRKVVENALLSSASAVILSHNHPSGIALPSQADYVATEQAYWALKAVGIALVDHIIVADDDFVSFADSGYLPDGTEKSKA